MNLYSQEKIDILANAIQIHFVSSFFFEEKCGKSQLIITIILLVKNDDSD
jgi:hypothetical protein